MKIEGHRLRAFFFKPILFILNPNQLTRGKDRKRLTGKGDCGPVQKEFPGDSTLSRQDTSSPVQ
ncbi:coiled-coil domain containing 5, isoform CRA_c [Rattus norvegicus]|uniref:Coiled-coil domain containing 5, isoform CRA_c n=1 Tax=Rattus norvegicus TaxID=10116 RepID=A6KMV7_RAT|nr:coiled-coil domain containing 5, isoform CRA_c [Rattus norvegicus]